MLITESKHQKVNSNLQVTQRQGVGSSYKMPENWLIIMKEKELLRRLFLVFMLKYCNLKRDMNTENVYQIIDDLSGFADQSIVTGKHQKQSP